MPGYPILRLATGGRTGRYFVVLMLGERRGWAIADNLRTVPDRDRALGRAAKRFQALMSELGERRMDELAGWLSERLRDPA